MAGREVATTLFDAFVPNCPPKDQRLSEQDGRGCSPEFDASCNQVVDRLDKLTCEAGKRHRFWLIVSSLRHAYG